MCKYEFNENYNYPDKNIAKNKSKHSAMTILIQYYDALAEAMRTTPLSVRARALLDEARSEQGVARRDPQLLLRVLALARQAARAAPVLRVRHGTARCMNASGDDERVHARHLVAAARLERTQLWLGERECVVTRLALERERSSMLFSACSALPTRVEPKRLVAEWCA